MKVTLPILGICIALAACSQDKAPAAPASESGPAPASSALPVSPSSTSTSAEFPAAMRGRWALVPADCTSTRGDAKGLLTIEPTSMRFYESVARLTQVQQADEQTLRGSFDFSGEGQTWTSEQQLTLENGGRVLVRIEHGVDAVAVPYRYTRCGT